MQSGRRRWNEEHQKKRERKRKKERERERESVRERERKGGAKQIIRLNRLPDIQEFRRTDQCTRYVVIFVKHPKSKANPKLPVGFANKNTSFSSHFVYHTSTQTESTNHGSPKLVTLEPPTKFSVPAVNRRECYASSGEWHGGVNERLSGVNQPDVLISKQASQAQALPLLHPHRPSNHDEPPEQQRCCSSRGQWCSSASCSSAELVSIPWK